MPALRRAGPAERLPPPPHDRAEGEPWGAAVRARRSLVSAPRELSGAAPEADDPAAAVPDRGGDVIDAGAHLGLVIRIARQIYPMNGVEADDVIGAGTVGLVQAAARYDE